MIQHITSMFRKLSAQLMTAIVINMLLSPAIAEVISQPAGLMPGDQYRLFFMTSGERDATSTDIEDYDAFVQHHADRSPVLAALGLNWKAVVSTPTVAARDNTEANPEVDGDGVPIYLINGELLGRHNSGLWEHEISRRMDASSAEGTAAQQVLDDLRAALGGNLYDYDYVRLLRNSGTTLSRSK